MFLEVAQSPGAADDGLDAEDVGLGAVDFALHYAGDVGLELHVVDQQHLAAFEECDVEVALVGALFAALRVDAEDAGGVGGFEAEAGEAAVVVVVDADMQVVAFCADEHGAPLADHILQQVGVVGIEVVGSEVEGDVECGDIVGGVEPHAHPFGGGGEADGQQQ